MKRILFLSLFLMSVLSVSAQSFQEFLNYFPEKKAPFAVTHAELLASVNTRIDEDLAWKYIWDENEFLTPEETFSHPIAQYMLNDKILVILYSEGKPGEVLFYTATVKTFNIKKQEAVDEFPVLMTSFNDGKDLVGSFEVYADGTVKGVSLNKIINDKTIIEVFIDKKGYLEYE